MSTIGFALYFSSTSVLPLITQNLKYQSLTTSVWMKQVWCDEALTWNPDHFDNITHLIVPPTDIWIPDICLYNKYVFTLLNIAGTGIVSCFIPNGFF